MLKKFKSNLRFLWSFIWGFSVEKVESKLNGTLEVRYDYGKYVLNSPNANYSFGLLHKVFQKTFKEINIQNRKIENVLLLGFGVGSVVSILQEELQIYASVKAVEYDEVILQLGCKYFNTQRFQHLSILQVDAFDFVKKEKEQYDLIVVDLFNDTEVPEQFLREEFISNLSNLTSSDNGLICFNMITNSKKKKEKFELLKNHFEKNNGIIKVVSPHSINKVIFHCFSGDI